MKIRKDDTVRVISGKDRGRTGRVLRVDAERHRVVVEGCNIQKRHTRPRGPGGAQNVQNPGGIVETEGAIHISNVMLLDPKSGDPTRVGIKRNGARRVRFAKRSGEEID
ncbi:MAG TPA: 50S ribosomal protein L24 [Thermoleophilaceae bacterium]|nr:50S ribosomal protein L24 [Thermoleophilaceae bacterium]